MTARRGAGDDGLGSVLVLAIGLCLLVASTLVTTLGGVALARHRAETAADLGALAGAAELSAGEKAACTAAVRVTGANGARLLWCRASPVALELATEVRPGGLAGRLAPRAARARARAGPEPAPRAAEPAVGLRRHTSRGLS